MIKTICIKKVTSYPHYDIRHEVWEVAPGDTYDMVSAYSKQGDYIGNLIEAYQLVNKYGIIHFCKRSPDHCVVSYGYSPKNKKWYGWSHRAIFGFKPGSKCKKGHCHYLPKRNGGKGEWTAKTWEDAKQMAMDFAKGVS